ncbi:MAG TPA: hypothetical protein VN326_10060 [Casimicrobiaceae bacterium]|jgi:hypothetical protein|nr:hypothetical protein [Casimicrobiaceae bacterium]
MDKTAAPVSATPPLHPTYDVTATDLLKEVSIELGGIGYHLDKIIEKIYDAHQLSLPRLKRERGD